jgi:hypothetical protein
MALHSRGLCHRGSIRIWRLCAEGSLPWQARVSGVHLESRRDASHRNRCCAGGLEEKCQVCSQSMHLRLESSVLQRHVGACGAFAEVFHPCYSKEAGTTAFPHYHGSCVTTVYHTSHPPCVPLCRGRCSFDLPPGVRCPLVTLPLLGRRAPKDEQGNEDGDGGVGCTPFQRPCRSGFQPHARTLGRCCAL